MEYKKTESSKSKILLDQVEDLYKNLSYANWSVILISSFMVWILWPVTNREHLMYWDAYILSIVLIREDIAIRYNKASVTSKSANIWLKLYIAGTFLSGIGWGMALILVVPPNLFIYLVTTSFLIGGLVTGSAATLASLKYGFAVFSIPALLPGALYLIYLDGHNTFNVGVSLLFFLIFILFIALRMHKTIYYSLKQQVEVSSKLSALEVEKSELEFKIDKLHDELEFEQKQVQQFKGELKQWQYPGTKVRQIGSFNDARLVTLLESLQGGVWDMNLKTGDVTFSDSWVDMLGYKKEDVPRTFAFWESVLHPDDKLSVINKLNAFSEGKQEIFSSTHRLKNCEGEWIWVMARANGVIWGSYGELLNVVGMEIYLPDSRESAEKAQNIFNFEKSTAFISSENFNDRLQHLVKTASVDGIEHSLCYLKIIQLNDHFNRDKSLEEIYLYEVGRKVLQEFRQGDAILRLGSESFVMLLEFCNVEDAWEKAFTLKNTLNAMQIDIKGEKYRVTVAIGITPISNSASTVQDLMQDAEQACDLAVKETSNLIYLYQKDDLDIGANMFEKLVAKRIRACIANNEIGISALSMKALSAIADHENIFSVRFKLKENVNEHFPGVDYNTIIRKNFLSLALDLFVIRNLFEWIKSNPSGIVGKKGIYIYECSVISYQDERFMELIMEELNSHPELNDLFCFGISETCYQENTEMMGTFIEKLKSAGSRIALTDVGSTSMTIKLLQDFPLDFLKIDKAILQNLEKDNSNYITLKYINDISHLMGMKSIIEEVNDASLLRVLDTIKIDYMQESTDFCTEIVIK